MKEFLIRIPEDSEQIITAVMEKFGVKTSEVKTKKIPAKKILIKHKKIIKSKIDHTYLFNKWKVFDIDPKTLREQSW